MSQIRIQLLPELPSNLRLASARALSASYFGAFSRRPWNEDLVRTAFTTLNQQALTADIWVQASVDCGQGEMIPIGAAIASAAEDVAPALLEVLMTAGVPPAKTVFLKELFVAEGLTGRGVGAQLLAAFEAEAFRLGYRYLSLHTHCEHHSGGIRRFYANRRYAPIFEPYLIPGDPAPRVVMTKQFSEDGHS